MMSQGCVLLLNLKQYLKEAYGFTDAKISLYSPTEAAKVYDKPLNRRPTARFVPKQVIQVINSGEPPDELDDKAKKQLILAYLDVSTGNNIGQLVSPPYIGNYSCLALSQFLCFFVR